MDSISSTNSLVTQVFDSGSDKNVIDHYRYIHPRNTIPSAIEVQHNKTTAVVTPSTKRRPSFEQSETEATKKHRRYENHCKKLLNIYLGNETETSDEDSSIDGSVEVKQEVAEDVAEEKDEDYEDEDNEDNENDEGNENEIGLENDRNIKVESSDEDDDNSDDDDNDDSDDDFKLSSSDDDDSDIDSDDDDDDDDDDDTFDHFKVWQVSNDYESRIKALERENEELKEEIELAKTNLAEARTIISNLKGYVHHMKDI